MDLQSEKKSKQDQGELKAEQLIPIGMAQAAI